MRRLRAMLNRFRESWCHYDIRAHRYTSIRVFLLIFFLRSLLPFVSVRPRRRKNTLSCIFLRGAIDDVKASKNVLYFANNGSDTLTTTWYIRHQKNIHLSVLSKSEEKESNIFHSSFRHSSILNVIRVIERANYYLRRSIYAPFYTYVLASDGGEGRRRRRAKSSRRIGKSSIHLFVDVPRTP